MSSRSYEVAVVIPACRQAGFKIASLRALAMTQSYEVSEQLQI